jgi:hypothetical protein
MVTGAVLLIAFKGDTENRIGSIQANTSLETAGRDVSTISLHHHLLDQIFGTSVQMGKPVDLFPG